MKIAQVLFVLLCLYCAERSPGPTGSGTSAGGVKYTYQRFILDDPRLRGMSGLAVDSRGVLWSVTEKSHRVIMLPFANGRVRPRVFSLEGVDESLDTESLVWIDRNTIALGTEDFTQRASTGRILFATKRGARFIVSGERSMPYKMWGLVAWKNHGIEGICFTGSYLFAAAETFITKNDIRMAPLGAYSRELGTWRSMRIVLNTKTGKISALDCRTGGAGLVPALAIERHYGTMRLLEFELKPAGAPLIRTRTLLDLSQIFQDDPNPEGVARLPDGRIAIITDNDTGGVSRPTELILIRF